MPLCCRTIMTLATTALVVGVAGAQSRPMPGERDATSTALTLALPRPDPAFRGKIGETIKDSTPDYPAPIKAPKGAPNVLIILLDDVGFGQTSTFGGPVPTPTLDRLASGGLRYNTFHTTALCSPTRAALLTGRNHHSAGSGVIIETGTGYPGYTGIIPQSTALLPEILRGNGYATAMFGKWHNTPEAEINPAGPFKHWPTGLGFDYFYGFNQGETSQWYPVLYRNTIPVAQPKQPEQGYHFAADMTDEAIKWIGSIRAAKQDQPWFMYYASAAAHAPHHAPKAWQDKFRGKFDHGWDQQREITFAEQKRLGVIPQDAKLATRPREIPAWDDQPAEAKRIYARLMENYAAYLSYADNELGRLIDSIAQAGELDNTLIFYIVGDNGASAEGGPEGSFNDIASLLGYNPGLEILGKRIEEIGGPSSEPQVPVGWAWAMNTPFQWTKQVASHFGGTRNPMVVYWPNGIRSHGELRTQFHHVIDVVPTILEATHVPAPKTVNGITQKPMEGVSMMYSFDDAKAGGRRSTQYFEMFANRAIYHDGWVAASRFGVPWNIVGRVGNFLDAPWELYHIDTDFSEADDVAASNPQKLRQLQALFVEEAGKYDVFPLDSRFSERGDPRNRTAGELPKNWTYRGNNVLLPEPSGPRVYPNSHVITATLTIPRGGVDGVIAAAGGKSGGWSLYVLDGKLTYHYNSADFEHSTVAARTRLPAGRVAVRLEYVSNGPKRGSALNKGAIVKLFVNDTLVGEGPVGTGMRRHGAEPFEVGRDSISPVSPDYKSKGAFPFSGEIEQISFAAAPAAAKSQQISEARP